MARAPWIAITALVLVASACGDDAGRGAATATAPPTAAATAAPTTSDAPSRTSSPVVVTAAPASPTPSVAPSVEVTSDLQYVEAVTAEATSFRLDVYAPVTPGPHPVVVLLHGGGATRFLTSVVKVSEQLAESGVVVFTPTHGGTGTPASVVANDGRRLREAMEDVWCATSYATAHAGEYGGDPENMTVVGQSGGGFLGMLAVLGGNELQAAWNEFGAVRQSTVQVRCVADAEPPSLHKMVGFNGAYFVMMLLLEDDPALWRLGDVRAYIPGDRVVVRMIVGGRDTLTPDWHVAETEPFLAELQAAGHDAEVVFIEEASHGFTVEGPIWEETLATILEVVAAG